jgi:hypothetical protein
MREVVDSEVELVAVRAGLALERDHACVVDEDVELSVISRNPPGELARLLERGEVGEVALGAVGQLVHDRVELRLIAPMREHRDSRGREPAGDLQAEAVGRARDQDGVVWMRGHRK